MNEHLDYLAQIQPAVQRVEARKEDILKVAIDDHLPHFAASDTRTAVRFALATLDNIRQGNHPQYEPLLRAKAKELGIDLDLAA
ncbi:MAG: hypothetical protein NTZ25_01825 [Candidatus Peregrinibacteria bacterium]|nr:hypothetical protein [Candidatus Peregrinibacteria bacterium]